MADLEEDLDKRGPEYEALRKEAELYRMKAARADLRLRIRKLEIDLKQQHKSLADLEAALAEKEG